MNVSPIPTTRIHKDHPNDQIIGDINLATQTRRMTKISEENAMVKQKDDGIFISQDKYVADILKKFDFVTMKTASTPIETNKALLKDEEAEDVDVHLYRSMIGSMMYLTASRLGIMFVVCACARFQVTPKVSHLYAVKRIFRYLKGQPKLGLWYPRDSPFDLEAFSDSDYAGASLDRKSTTGAEYVAVANYCRQVLWIQNQMLDYGFNFMNTKINIDNESTICIVKNPVFHSKAKHIEIRHNFIRDSYEKRLIQVIKIHTDHNVVDLLTKTFDVSSISDEFRVKTGGCKVNAARQNLVLMDEINDVKQIHATVDVKTIVISESSVRSALYFNDEDGITCLTNDAIFENLAFMRNLDTNTKKFLMYQRFLQLFLNNQITLVEPFNDVYQTPADTKKVFTNMKRKGKDFSGRVTPLFASMLAPPVVEGKGDRPRCQEAIGGVIAQTMSERASKHSYDLPLPGGNTPRSDKERLEQDDLMDFVPPTPYDSLLLGGHTPGSHEGRPNINELMAICTNLSSRVLALEQSKTTQDLVIRWLKKKVRKLEKKLRARTLGLNLFKIGTSKRKSLDKENVSKQGRKSDKTKPMFEDSDFVEIDMENVEGDAETQGRNTAEHGDTVNTASIDVSATGPLNVSTADSSTSTAGDIFKDKMVTIADTLVAIRSTRPRTTSVVIHDVEEEPRRATPVPIIQRDAEIAQRLYEEEQAHFEREQRIAREKAAEQEAKDAVLIEQIEDI
ncbi:hypothetical protein Tco_0618272 [Tanacetum coccineum]